MQSLEYKGFLLTASYFRDAGQLLPSVTLSKTDGSSWTLVLSPPATGVRDQDAALRAGFDFARKAIDGELPGYDVTQL